MVYGCYLGKIEIIKISILKQKRQKCAIVFDNNMVNELIKRHKLGIAFLGDIIVFFLSITLVLYIRYGGDNFLAELSVHREPFIIVLILWLLVFYISNLYTYKAFHNVLEIIRHLITALLISFFITITIFYIFSRFFNLTPKANLVMFTVIFGALDLLWRYILRRIFIRKEHRSNVLIIASSPLVDSITEHIQLHPQLGYSLYHFDSDITQLTDTIKKYSIDIIIIDGQTLKDKSTTKILYGLLPKKVELMMFTDFYESLFGCVPLSEIEEEWFIREITENKNIYESTKRLIEIICSFIGLIIAIPFALIISLFILLTSRGPVIYKQERIGRDNRPFILYKFRTMRTDQAGPLWTTPEDGRVTSVGRFLRHTHFDEIPQLLNVLRGDLSFIGPRPERTELVKMYENIPYYDIRHIIKPGIVGWAQLNYKPSISLDEAEKKFQFDLYYLKNRSLTLDIFIVLKTIRTIF